MNRTTTDGEFTFAQSIKHPQLFADGTRREVLAQSPFAVENLLQVERHGRAKRTKKEL